MLQFLQDVIFTMVSFAESEHNGAFVVGAADTAPDEEQGAEMENADGSESSASTVCRICQLTEKESGQPMSRTGCKCHGSLSACHQTCLQRWVDSRLNEKCEICEENFAVQVSPDVLYADSEPMMPNIEPPQAITCAESRRTFFFIIFFLLFFATTASVALTAYTNHDYLHQQLRFWNTSVDLIALEDMRFVYGLSISILVFCACMCISVGLIWAFAELYLWPQERFIRRQQILQLARMLNEGAAGLGPAGVADGPRIGTTNNGLPVETITNGHSMETQPDGTPMATRGPTVEAPYNGRNDMTVTEGLPGGTYTSGTSAGTSASVTSQRRSLNNNTTQDMGGDSREERLANSYSIV